MYEYKFSEHLKTGPEWVNSKEFRGLIVHYNPFESDYKWKCYMTKKEFIEYLKSPSMEISWELGKL